MRAIDLYAGIGGWSLGLKLAGIEVVDSYEWWSPAIKTHGANHGKEFEATNIRELDLSKLPDEIDMVVGSPPCTQFSYANRGGSGDMEDGLKDLVAFFSVVAHLKPKFWAMENVPRVAKVLEAGFADTENPLYEFRDLDAQITIVDFAKFGTPQARRRCVATNIPLERIEEYRDRISDKTLGDVISALRSADTVRDPVWGTEIPAAQLTDHVSETPLNAEECRMNREAKEFHPVYNNMAFPDRQDLPARTVTATCTRVSRESIVISDPDQEGQYRRLTIRERACLQGFPITYQLHGKTFAEKAKMVGNAIPPTYPYLLACAAKGIPFGEFKAYDEVGAKLTLPATMAPTTLPDTEGKTYPRTRKFRAAIPGLRFKSGMRFELANSFSDDEVKWRASFYFGSSKDIREYDLVAGMPPSAQKDEAMQSWLREMEALFLSREAFFARTDPEALQRVWARKAEGTGPYDVVDALGEIVDEGLIALDNTVDLDALETAADEIVQFAGGDRSSFPGQSKMVKYVGPILVGLATCSWFNSLKFQQRQKLAA